MPGHLTETSTESPKKHKGLNKKRKIESSQSDGRDPVSEPAPAAQQELASDPTEGSVDGRDKKSATQESGPQNPDEQADEAPADVGFRIQVSAKHLILASSVFRKTLTGAWKESFTLLEKGSVELTADGWDLEALLVLLRIFHCQHHEVPKNISLELLAKILVLADYYECQPAVRFFFDIWVTPLKKSFPSTYGRDMVLWLWVSWFFKMPAEFKKATSVVMSQAKGPVSSLALPIPERVISEFESILSKFEKCS